MVGRSVLDELGICMRDNMSGSNQSKPNRLVQSNEK
jgi:hypothetical protein